MANPEDQNDDELDLVARVDKNPQLAAVFAINEFRHGRLEWLAEHIRRSEFQIEPRVAQELLHLIQGTGHDTLFQLKLVRRPRLGSQERDPKLMQFRAMGLALAVARCGGWFRRGYLLDACETVGKNQKPKIGGDRVRKLVKPYRQRAMDAVIEEILEEAYHRGELGILAGQDAHDSVLKRHLFVRK